MLLNTHQVCDRTTVYFDLLNAHNAKSPVLGQSFSLRGIAMGNEDQLKAFANQKLDANELALLQVCCFE